jgi:hypothetical protein
MHTSVSAVDGQNDESEWCRNRNEGDPKKRDMDGACIQNKTCSMEGGGGREREGKTGK